MKSGFVSLTGRPNVGKSTLINEIVNEKVAITSNVSGTTRNNIQGIYNDTDSQIVFIDTPGIHKPKHKLAIKLNEEAYYTVNDVDVILFLIDATSKFGKGDLFVLDKIKTAKKPVFLIINKIDKITKEELFNLIMEYKNIYNFNEIIPVSALKKNNIKELINTLKKYLPDNIMYYPQSDYTNTTIEFRVSELIREKILRLTNEEVPHSIACVIDDYKEYKDKCIIGATIIVERNSVKRIIIGKSGNLIKEIGTLSRIDIEKMIGKKVYLSLFVKVIKDWRNKEKYLKEFGFYEID